MALSLSGISISGRVSAGATDLGPFDPYYENVSLLAHFDGTNASTVFTDNSTRPKTLTAVGNAQINTAIYKFETGSLLLDGSGDYATIPSNADFNFGSGDFTIECWVRPGALGTAGFFSTYESTGTVGVVLGTDASGKPRFKIGNDSAPGNNSDILSGTALATNTWTALAAVRSGNTMYLFVNGVLAGSLVTSRTVNTSVAYIGKFYVNTGAFTFNGRIDELRVTKGIARYTSNYTPDTEPFPSPTVPPVADFTANILSGAYPLSVNFTDTSTYTPTSWLWDFKNDGTATSTSQNPTYVYSSAGTYSVKLTATNAYGSNNITKTSYITVTVPATGEISYTTYGTYTWVAPEGVTSVSVVVVGGGGWGGNAASGTEGTAGGQSYFVAPSTVGATGGATGISGGGAAGGSYSGGSGANGGAGGQVTGGGAAGYTGNGGAGVSYNTAGNSGSGGGGGSGGVGVANATVGYGGGGGGVGLFGQGANGAGGAIAGQQGGFGGSGGSNGTAGVQPNCGDGGNYGGGGSGGYTYGYGGAGGGLGWRNNIAVIPGQSYTVVVGRGGYGTGGGAANGGYGGSGAVRIIWGAGRSFPSNAA